MTAVGRIKKRLWRAFGAALLAAAIFFPLVRQASGLTERVVVSLWTGLAIGGFDPVAFYTDSAAKPGLSDHEYRFAGVVWRFRNEGNLAAFKAHPEIYAPLFGGYDPIALGRGVPLAGHPEIWLIDNDRLILFYDAASRRAFLERPAAALAQAKERWPEVASQLIGPDRL